MKTPQIKLPTDIILISQITAGKETLGKQLQAFDFLHVSLGDVFRSMDTGEDADFLIPPEELVKVRSRGLVEDDTTFACMAHHYTTTGCWLRSLTHDGPGRTVKQATRMEEFIFKHRPKARPIVLELNGITLPLVLERTEKRRKDRKRDLKPERTDDTPADAAKAFKAYADVSDDLLASFRKWATVHTLDASGSALNTLSQVVDLFGLRERAVDLGFFSNE